VRHLADREDLWDRPDTQKAFAMLDYSQYGGALVLGVQGNAVICHGSSNANAIKHAIRVAIQSVRSKVTSHIGQEFTDSAASGAA
jgi:phosphate acyltransferase